MFIWIKPCAGFPLEMLWLYARMFWNHPTCIDSFQKLYFDGKSSVRSSTTGTFPKASNHSQVERFQPELAGCEGPDSRGPGRAPLITPLQCSTLQCITSEHVLFYNRRPSAVLLLCCLYPCTFKYIFDRVCSNNKWITIRVLKVTPSAVCQMRLYEVKGCWFDASCLSMWCSCRAKRVQKVTRGDPRCRDMFGLHNNQIFWNKESERKRLQAPSHALSHALSHGLCRTVMQPDISWDMTWDITESCQSPGAFLSACTQRLL